MLAGGARKGTRGDAEKKRKNLIQLFQGKQRERERGMLQCELYICYSWVWSFLGPASTIILERFFYFYAKHDVDAQTAWNFS